MSNSLPVSELCKAIKLLRLSYEEGSKTIQSGICFTLAFEYDIDYAYDLISEFYPQETTMIGSLFANQSEPYTKLGPRGIFTQERYDFLATMLKDAESCRFDEWIDVWLMSHQQLSEQQ